MSFEKDLYNHLASDPDISAKAIANYLFREIIEDAHTKYGIPQADIRRMCKSAVNRAAVLEKMMSDENMHKALVFLGYDTREWDAPDTDEVNKELEKLRYLLDTLA